MSDRRSRSRSFSRSPRRSSRSPSRSRSPIRKRSLTPRRSYSRSRSPVRRSLSSIRNGRSRSPVRRGRSRSPVRRGRSISPRGRARSYSRSPPPRSRSRSRSLSRPIERDYKARLERLYDTGKVKPSDIDDSTLDALDDLDEVLADCAVQRFAEANFGKINHKNGFFMGIIKRIKIDGPDKGTGDVESLPRPVRNKVLDLIDDRRILKDDLDSRVCRALGDLSTDMGVEAVEKFAMANLDNVRSKTGFMMGIIKRIQDDARGGRGYGGGRYDSFDRRDRGYGGGGGGYGRDRYDRGDRYDRDRGRDRYR